MRRRRSLQPGVVEVVCEEGGVGGASEVYYAGGTRNEADKNKQKVKKVVQQVLLRDGSGYVHLITWRWFCGRMRK
jgi:hypothetical protein